MSAHVTIGGEAVSSVRLTLPARGVWWADVDLELAPDVRGTVALRIGEREWRGAIDATRSGTHMERRSVRLVGGAGSWARSLPSKHYHSDAGVRARIVIEDAAREAGERVSIDAAVGDRVLGIDYVRSAGPASRAIEDALGTSTWWLDADGVTQVAASRPESDVAEGAYEVLEFDPRSRVAVVAVDDVGVVGVGSRLTTRLDAPQVVREVELVVTPESVRVRARCSSEADSLPSLFRSVVEKVTGSKLWGRWRFRVTKLNGDRIELQPVRRDAGLPDVLPVSMWPGVAGAHALLALGALVHVEFIEGDRTQPMVVGFSGKDGTGHVPSELHFTAETAIRFGGAEANESLAYSSRLLAELNKISATLESLALNPSTFLPEFTVTYVPPASASDLGTVKTKAN